MSNFRLPRLPYNLTIVDENGRPAVTFQMWWQNLVTSIETQEATQDALIAAVDATEANITVLQTDLTALTGVVATKLSPADIGVTVQGYDADLAAIAALSTLPFGRSLLTQVDAAAVRATIGAGTSSTSGTVTSITGSGGTTGLTLTGGPITTSGTLTLGGTLAVANGGTGVTTSTGTTAVVLATKPQFTNTIGVGVAANASGAGISFPATQSASTDPNTLDDYEEGTWTPTISAGTGTITTSSGIGSYTKVGRLVTATMSLTITTNGTGASYIVASLPFTSGPTYSYIGSGRDNGVSGKMLTGNVVASTSNMTILNYDSTYPAANGSVLVVTVSYFV